jgi:hypothetical protein
MIARPIPEPQPVTTTLRGVMDIASSDCAFLEPQGDRSPDRRRA